MNIDSAYPSTYLKASDLQGKTAKVIIKNVVTETVGSDAKPIMYFEGKAKGLVLNRTNANTISMVYGHETTDWEGGELELFETMVDFQGRSVPAIRVRVPPRKPAQQGKITMAPNARDRAMAEQAPAPPPDNGYRGDPMDDEIPFSPEWR